MGVSGGISEGERLRAKGEAKRTAPRAADENLVIIMIVGEGVNEMNREAEENC